MLRRRTATDPGSPVTIRVAGPDDAAELARLCERDSRPLPAGPVAIAERHGRIHAALALRDGTAVADPFEPTASLVALLRAWAAELDPPPAPQPAPRRRLTVRAHAWGRA